MNVLYVNSLCPRGCGSNFKRVVLELILQIDILNTQFCEIAHMWMPQNPIDEKLALVQVMAWCRHQAITWANVDPDLCCHMALPGYNELTVDDLLAYGGLNDSHVLKDFLTLFFMNFTEIYC